MADLRSLEVKIRNRALEVMTSAMRDVTAQTILAAPAGGTGELRRSISHGPPVLAGTRVVSTLRATAEHAGIYAFGARAHPIVSHGPWPLRNRDTGQVFGRFVNHPGNQGHPEFWSEAVIRQRFNGALGRAAG